MRKQDFRFDLPEALIANEPSENRTQSRLMLLNPENQTVNHRRFYELIDFIEPNDCLIFNNTKVIPARLRGTRDSGGTVEILVERVVPGEAEDICIAQVKASNSPKPGTKIQISADFSLEVLGRDGAFYRLKSLSEQPLFAMIEAYGSMPLPPYIKRSAEEADKQRYQTVFAAKQGAVAAPTAGLHFDQQLMDKIRGLGIATDFVTLHVGAGTFSPVRVDNILEHQMHSEWFEVPESVVALIEKTRKAGGRVIAVGTTSVRCLESASVSGAIQASRGETDIFIYPGYQFKSVDALITNFHLSESTLLMLVSAFAGREFILQSYQQAVTEQYRFFSYGDAMFIQNRIS
jgi:S-adenosylmethionine:tRNA ribosyltransferase-isomerase